jgi:hypothetical protein
MSYRNLIDKQITKAFNLIKDLAIPANLQLKLPSNFDFENAAANTSTESIVAIKIVFVSEKKKGSTFEAVVMFQKKGIDDINLYDKITANDIEWRISSTSVNDSFVYTLKIYREL